MSHSRSVRDYYEQNGAWFRLVGRRQRSQAIHRPVWAKGVRDRVAALNFVNERVAEQVESISPRSSGQPLHMLDLGCGYGASLLYLMQKLRRPMQGTGITVSAQQAQQALVQAQHAGVYPACNFVEGDFHHIPLADASVDVVYSVEAFVHAEFPEGYLGEAARVLRPGGRLIICDDFRTERDLTERDLTERDLTERDLTERDLTERDLTERDCSGAQCDEQARWLELFQTGWHVPHLPSEAQVCAMGRRYGLGAVAHEDLSAYLHLRRFPIALLPIFDRLMGTRGALASPVESIVGGWALEQAIHLGAVAYCLLVLEKAAPVV